MKHIRQEQVQDTASLHENAVQAIAKGEVAPFPRKTRRAAQNRNQAVHTHIVVDPQVMQAAKELLLGSYTRIEIISEDTVIVR